ncbi:MAG: hypothetical protein WAM53_03235 [Terrimicrobiaceae bacterium]
MRALCAALSGLLLATPCVAQQVPTADKPADVTEASPGVTMPPEYAKAIGRLAYMGRVILHRRMGVLVLGKVTVTDRSAKYQHFADVLCAS